MTLLVNFVSMSVHLVPALVSLSVQSFPTESFIAPTADLSALAGCSAILITKVKSTIAPLPMMKFNDQDRSYARVTCDRPEGKCSSQLPSLVTLSEAKGLSR